METILNFLNEMRRSDWSDLLTPQQRKYNDVTVIESEQSYYNKIVPLYSAATISLVNVPTEKYDILKRQIEEAEEIQKYFEMPSDELLNSLMHDYEQSHHQTRSLKEDYEYLIFVRGCMKIQKYFLENFKSKILNTPTEMTDNKPTKDKKEEAISTKQTEQDDPIKGVKGLAAHLSIGITKAQAILNSGILQNEGVAYRVGNGWNINPNKLDKILSENPNLLYSKNK